MSVTRPYLPWNLRNYFVLLVNDKITASFQIYMSNICLPSITSSFTNNKNELWKTCQTNKFSKTTIQIVSIFFKFVRPSLPLYLQCYLYLLLTFLGGYFIVHSIWCQLVPLDCGSLSWHSFFKQFRATSHTSSLFYLRTYKFYISRTLKFRDSGNSSQGSILYISNGTNDSFVTCFKLSSSCAANTWSTQEPDWIKLAYSALIYLSGSSGGMIL